MENKLIRLTEFVNRIDELVPENKTSSNRRISEVKDKYEAIKRYAAFLSQPLTLSMFVPVDDKDNVLTKNSMSDNTCDDDCNHKECVSEMNECIAYNNAKSKVLFEGWNLRCRKKNLGFKIVYCDDFEINLDTLSTEWIVEGGSFSGKLIGNTIGQVADQFRGIILSETALKQIYG